MESLKFLFAKLNNKLFRAGGIKPNLTLVFNFLHLITRQFIRHDQLKSGNIELLRQTDQFG